MSDTISRHWTPAIVIQLPRLTPPPHHHRHHRPSLPVYFWLHPCFSSPFWFFFPPRLHISFALSCHKAETQANCERPNIPQISGGGGGGVFGDLDADRKTTKSSVECPNEFSNDNMIIKAEKERNIKEKWSTSAERAYVSLCLIGSLGSGDLTFYTGLLLLLWMVIFFRRQRTSLGEGGQAAWEKTPGCMLGSVSVTVTEDREFQGCQKSGPGKTQQHHERSQGRKAKSKPQIF